MNPDKYRPLFPVTAQKIYMNHAAISPLSTRATDALDSYINDRSFGSIDSFPRADAARNRAREILGDMINADPKNIAFIGNTSEGFNHLVNGLSWQPGDQVILTDYEFPSNIYPFKNLERLGVEMVYVPNRDGQIFIEDIAARITSRTRLLSISYVEFSNGFRNDLQAIGDLCHNHGIIFSVDSIQGLGGLPLDVQKWRIDFISNGGHKWLMGPMGAGFMYIAPQLFDKITPAYTGWLGVEDAWDFFDYRLDLLPDARRFEYGTSNFMGISALSASLELLQEAGLSNIETHLLGLGQTLKDGLEDLGMRFMGAAEKKHWSGIYSFSGKESEQLFEYLVKENIICSLRNGLIRIAPHFYNTRQEVTELIERVATFYSQS